MAFQAKQIAQQRLIMAPNVALALEVLRMAAMELQTFVEQQLEDNPILELEEPYPDQTASSSSADGDTPPQAADLDDEGRWEAQEPEESNRERTIPDGPIQQCEFRMR